MHASVIHSIHRMPDILTVTATGHEGIGSIAVTNNDNVCGLTQSGKEVCLSLCI